jgi:triosephosphate isomerase
MEAYARPLIAGNWKMNGLRFSALAEIERLCNLVAFTAGPMPLVAVCPPATLIGPVAAKIAERGLTLRIAVGGQDCHAGESGAHTGDIAAVMLRDAGAAYCIVGHSERRADHGETSEQVAAKAAAAIAAGLTAIVCVGETLAERDAGRTIDVVGDQLAKSLPPGANAANCVVAYEPVWAIGTGRTPTVAEIAAVHDFARGRLAGREKHGSPVRLLYGGSVKPDNARDLMAIANVDGALVGGASLKAADFWPIVQAKG